MSNWRLKKQIPVCDYLIRENERPYIIAEMGCSHEGEMSRAKALIDAAVNTDADAVQLELFEPEDNLVPYEELYPLYEKLYFSPEQWKQLIDYTRGFDIAISTFVYDYKSLETALALKTDLIKLNSSDLSNPNMIIKTAESGIPITVGTGASTMEEVSRSIELYTEHGGDQMILMQGVQNFPTDIGNLHIRRMEILRNLFDCLVGYADHTQGGTSLSMIVDLLAMGMGASVIEKHITLDRSEKGVDHESALEPDEFKVFVKMIHDAFVALGPPRLRQFNESDFNYRLFQKKTIVAARDLEIGEILKKDDVRILRNSKAHGMSPMDVNAIIGKRICQSIKQYDHIQPNHLD